MIFFNLNKSRGCSIARQRQKRHINRPSNDFEFSTSPLYEKYRAYAFPSPSVSDRRDTFATLANIFPKRANVRRLYFEKYSARWAEHPLQHPRGTRAPFCVTPQCFLSLKFVGVAYPRREAFGNRAKN